MKFAINLPKNAIFLMLQSFKGNTLFAYKLFDKTYLGDNLTSFLCNRS